MKIHVTYTTHQGDRTTNQDALLIDKELIGSDALASPFNETKAINSKTFTQDKALFALADGMGGESSGERASFLVLSTFINEYESLHDTPSIIQTIHRAKEKLDSEASKDNTLLNFGSTIAGVLLHQDKATVFNCGDSRVYRLNGHFLEQLSRDHSYVQELVDEGVLHIDEVNTNPYKNILTSAIAGDLSDNQPQIEIKSIELTQNETFLLCSDGVWEAMSMEAMEACFNEPNRVECLIERVNEYENRDNFSMIVVEVINE